MKLPRRKQGRSNSLNKRWLVVITVVLSLGTIATVALTAPQQGTTEQRAPQPVTQTDVVPATRAVREERAIQEARRLQLAEKEAALAAKEEELKKLGAKLDAQLKALGEAKKNHEAMAKADEERRKQSQSERVTKMVKLFKTMKPSQSGELLDKMDEAEVKLLLDRLDTKTVAKLVPNLNQPRTIRWVNENLRLRGEK
jgi:flagellar motility protein MotE (MotC chaperone)